MSLPEQSLRPRRGGLEHLAVPGNARARQVVAAPQDATAPPDATAVVDPVAAPATLGSPTLHTPTRDTVPTQVARAEQAGPREAAPEPAPQEPGPPPLRPRPHAERPDRRSWVLIAVVAVAVLVVGGFAVTSLARGGGSALSVGAGDPDEPADAGDAGEAAGEAGAGTVDDPSRLATDALPASWADSVPGSVTGEPVRWVDAAGVNTLVLSTGTGAPGETDQAGSALAAGSLYVTLFLGEGDDPVVQRQMREPATPSCPEGTAFRDGSVRVSDHDGDGVGEVTTGWSVGCPDGAGVSTVKLSLLEGADKYILRGTGSATGESVDADAVGSTAEPDASRWPAGTHEATVALFDELFGE